MKKFVCPVCGYVHEAEAMPEAGLAGILQGTPYKQKKTFDFIIDGDKEIVLNVDK